MTATLQRVPAEFWEKWESVRAVDARPAPVESTEAPPPRPARSFGRRVLRSCVRFLIAFDIGVGGTLAWQAYGDKARQMLATAYPDQMGWLAPQAATTALAPSSAPPALVAAVPPPSVDQQQINTLSLNLAAVRQSVEQLATQVTSSQQQMSGDIARLQASEQDILNKISAPPPPRPAPATPRRPASPPVASTASPPAAR
jgi:hypothetical protein